MLPNTAPPPSPGDNPATGRVIVTGAGGTLGRVVTADLADHGWDVLAVDRVPLRDWRGESVSIDLTDYGSVLEVLSGSIDRHRGAVHAVVHLGAVPGPGIISNAGTFSNNVVATYNVFQAARVAGVKNVVWASSETLHGLPFLIPPPYVPLDEDSQSIPQSTYSLGKAIEEDMALHFSRWDPELTMTGLRFSTVTTAEQYPAFGAFDTDPHARKFNLWGYIDVRDGAQAVRLALQRHTPGAEVFLIANPDTVMSRSSADLMAEVFPGVEVRADLARHQSLHSIEKARRVLGFAPQHSWRSEAGLPPAVL